MDRKLISTKQKELVDTDTGEVISLEVEKTFRVKGTDSPFFMVYLNTMKSLFGLEHLSDLKLILKLCGIAEFNTGVVRITPADRKEICEELNIGNSNFSKYLKRLKDKGLISGAGGLFTINPDIFWRGDHKMRQKLIDENGFTITVSINDTDN